jgi:hypothetical protein
MSNTTTKKQAYEYMGLSKLQYEMNCMSQYLRWCMNWEKEFKIPLQCLLANRAMSNYYSAQFLELEHSFIIIAQKLDGLVDYEIMSRNFEMIMVDLYTNYPSGLIEDAKKVRIENPPLNSN